MKKFITMLLALAMVTCMFAGCGGSSSEDESGAASASDSEISVAMISDYEDITDQAFNQTTYEAGKAWCEENGVDFTYYKPAGDSTADRVAMIDAAVADEYNVLLLPGYAFADAIIETAEMYDDVKFIALDVSAADLGEDYEVPANVCCAVYQEEIAGYMAGYAAVKLGYKHLAYLGGMAVPAVVRYGYGFVQGVDAAAVELGIASDVTLEYVYGNQFFGDSDITSYMDTMYSKGVEVTFACGAGIYTSAAEAASKVGGKIIGVDVDQQGIIDGTYGEGLTVTSAMKGLGATVNTILSAIVDGNWEKYGYSASVATLGLVSETPEENYVQLAPSTVYEDGKFTREDYEELVSKLFNGEITVSNASDAMPATSITVNDLGTIK